MTNIIDRSYAHHTGDGSRIILSITMDQKGYIRVWQGSTELPGAGVFLWDTLRDALTHSGRFPDFGADPNDRRQTEAFGAKEAMEHWLHIFREEERGSNNDL